MRWLRNIVSVCLLVAAGAVALVTLVSDHSDDYGKVPLPQGGIVHLPQAKIIAFMKQSGEGADPIHRTTAPFSFEILPVAGGPPVPVASENDAPSATATQRSETLGELGAVAKFDIPAAGAYRISGSGDLDPGISHLEFGINSGTALFDQWRLLAALVGGAFLIALIPIPRGKGHWDDEALGPTGWSSDSRSPYAG